MDAYNAGRMTGMAVGVMVGIILIVILLKFINKDKSLRTEYDEMQNLTRLRGYKYAFYTVLGVEAVLCFVTSFIDIPAEPIVLHFAAIFIGVTVQAGYCIWNNAYVGLNTRLKRFIVVAIAISLVNLLVAFAAWKDGSLLQNGILQSQSVNLLCGMMFAILGIIAIAHKITDRGEEG